MGSVRVVADGAVVAEPEYFDTPSGANGVNIALYVNRQRKDKATGSYEDTGDVTKIRLTAWGELAESLDIHKGDIIEFQGTVYEREYEGKNGTGRSLESDWVDSITIKYRKDQSAVKEPVGAKSGAGDGWSSEPVW